ncbi:predicted protein [Histoplasma capsulatum var. duboisii H88]|uniref:Predicted protein n=1 Tax=Ajellomyces capsulatus (strain H88) TaxID=544711 RepID=F0UKM3_AJEC8|nr:predicted protein [Histoplasma capsulatum var. duboisii H88]
MSGMITWILWIWNGLKFVQKVWRGAKVQNRSIFPRRTGVEEHRNQAIILYPHNRSSNSLALPMAQFIITCVIG